MQSRLSELTTKQKQDHKKGKGLIWFPFSKTCCYRTTTATAKGSEKKKQPNQSFFSTIPLLATWGIRVIRHPLESPDSSAAAAREEQEVIICCTVVVVVARAKESAVAITIVAGWLGIEGFLTLVLRQLSYNRDLENLHFLSQDLSAQWLSPFFGGLCSGCRDFLRIGEQGLTEKCKRFQLLACERDFRGLPMLSCGEVSDAWILLLLQGAST